jgi:hypothetical protein
MQKSLSKTKKPRKKKRKKFGFLYIAYEINQKKKDQKNT